jgi:hypothetical protein
MQELFLSSVMSTGKMVLAQWLTSGVVSFAVALTMFFYLMKLAPRAPLLLLLVVVLAGVLFAVAAGVMLGNLIRQWVLAFAVLLLFFLTCGMIYWSVHERLRLFSPILQLYDLYDWQGVHLLGLLATALLFLGATVLLLPRLGGGKRSLTAWSPAVLAILLFAGLNVYEIRHDRSVEAESMQTLVVGSTEVAYSGVTEQQARKFGALYEAIRAEAKRLGLQNEARPLTVTRTYRTPGWTVTDNPVRSEGDRLRLDLFSYKHLEMNMGTDWGSEFFRQIVPAPAEGKGKQQEQEKKGYQLLKTWVLANVMIQNPEGIYRPERVEETKREAADFFKKQEANGDEVSQHLLRDGTVTPESVQEYQRWLHGASARNG